jgi:hypothetical protein
LFSSTFAANFNLFLRAGLNYFNEGADFGLAVMSYVGMLPFYALYASNCIVHTARVDVL